MNDYDDYFAYLQRRSRIGLLYRRYLLYPRLSRFLKGDTLDVGCGMGDFLIYRPQTVGVDINPNTVAWCCDQGLDARIMEPDILPFEDAIFDSVILDNVLEHLWDPTKLLNEIHRILSRQGRLVVGVPGVRGFAADSDHKRYYNIPALVSILGRNGFVVGCLFDMPIGWRWLGRHIPQFCHYGVFFRS